jgi:hypothetical protein
MTHIDLFYLILEMQKLPQDQQKLMISKRLARLHPSNLPECWNNVSQTVEEEIDRIR